MRKIGINYSDYFGKAINENFEILSRIGFNSVFTGFSDLSRTEEFAKAAQRWGLLYESIHAPFDRINDIWYAGEDGDRMLERICDCVKACGKFGIPVTVVHLSSGVRPPKISDIGNIHLERLVDTAVKNGVTLAFENQRKVSNLAYVLETFADVENVKFCWDIGHEACFSGGVEFMRLFGERLAYTHIHDNFSEFNKDLHLIPFDGNIDFQKKMDFLKKYNFSKTLTFEVIPQNSDLYSNYTCEEYYKKVYWAAEKLSGILN